MIVLKINVVHANVSFSAWKYRDIKSLICLSSVLWYLNKVVRQTHLKRKIIIFLSSRFCVKTQNKLLYFHSFGSFL